MKKTFSYSEYALWNKDRTAYVRRYIEGVEEPSTKPQAFGTIIHRTIGEPTYAWVKDMKAQGFKKSEQLVARKLITNMLRRRPEMSEVSMTAQLSTEIVGNVTLFSIFDGLNKRERELDEFKTAGNDWSWTQGIVDRNEQLSFYALVFHLAFHAYFKVIRLHRLNSQRGTVKTFETTRGPMDVWAMKDRVTHTISQIAAEGLWQKRMSRKDRSQLTFSFQPQSHAA